MNDLKPEDVMKALECCLVSNTRQTEDCEHCPFDECSKAVCQNLLAYHALALLREKDARIKELEEAQCAEFTCFVGEPHKVDHCPYGDEIVHLQKEIAEKYAHINELNLKIAGIIRQGT